MAVSKLFLSAWNSKHISFDSFFFCVTRLITCNNFVLKVGPLNHKRTLAFLNHFITHTVRFLNRFSCVCEEVQMIELCALNMVRVITRAQAFGRDELENADRIFFLLVFFCWASENCKSVPVSSGYIVQPLMRQNLFRLVFMKHTCVFISRWFTKWRREITRLKRGWSSHFRLLLLPFARDLLVFI